MSLTKGQPSVTVTYWIKGEQSEERTFDASNTTPAIIGLSPGQDPSVKVGFFAVLSILRYILLPYSSSSIGSARTR